MRARAPPAATAGQLAKTESLVDDDFRALVAVGQRLGRKLQTRNRVVIATETLVGGA